MSHLFILVDYTSDETVEAAPDDHTVILTCGVYKSRLTRSIPPKSGCTCWSHDDPYMWDLMVS